MRVSTIVASAALLRIVVAPMRRLSPDEAYYLVAARKGVSIVDHPPLLLWILRAADRLPGTVELRVRLVAVVLQAIAALGVVAIARAIAPEDARERSALWAALLATWGLMPFAGGLITTPDAPLLAATAWLFAIAARSERRRADLGALFALAAIAVLSKVVALLVVASVALGLVRRDVRGALATLLGGAVALPFARASLAAQAAHALGRGELVSAPYVGAVAALLAWVAGAFFLFSPPSWWLAAGARARMRQLPGATMLFATLLLALVTSALISGRPPEPNWIAPAVLPVFAIAATAAADTRSPRAIVALHVGPALAALLLWIAPDWLPARADPLARVPHDRAFQRASAQPMPRYATPAWSCVYDRACDKIDAIFTSYDSTLTAKPQAMTNR